MAGQFLGVLEPATVLLVDGDTGRPERVIAIEEGRAAALQRRRTARRASKVDIASPVSTGRRPGAVWKSGSFARASNPAAAM